MITLLNFWGGWLLIWSIASLFIRGAKSFFTLALICFALAKLITVGINIENDINSKTYKCTESINQEIEGTPLLGYGIQ